MRAPAFRTARPRLALVLAIFATNACTSASAYRTSFEDDGTWETFAELKEKNLKTTNLNKTIQPVISTFRPEIDHAQYLQLNRSIPASGYPSSRNLIADTVISKKGSETRGWQKTRSLPRAGFSHPLRSEPKPVNH